MSVAHDVQTMNHLRVTHFRVGSLCQLATFQNAPVSGCCDGKCLKVSRWLHLQVLPELWQVHIVHFRTSLRHRIFYPTAHFASLWNVWSQSDSFSVFLRFRSIFLQLLESIWFAPGQAAWCFAWIVATWEHRFNALDWFSVAFGCTSGSNADMFKRFFQWSGAKRALKRQLQLCVLS